MEDSLLQFGGWDGRDAPDERLAHAIEAYETIIKEFEHRRHPAI